MNLRSFFKITRFKEKLFFKEIKSLHVKIKIFKDFISVPYGTVLR